MPLAKNWVLRFAEPVNVISTALYWKLGYLRPVRPTDFEVLALPFDTFLVGNTALSDHSQMAPHGAYVTFSSILQSVPFNGEVTHAIHASYWIS